MGNIITTMGEHLSESDWERIRQFAETPAYKRSPDMLSGSARTEEPSDEEKRDDRDE